MRRIILTSLAAACAVLALSGCGAPLAVASPTTTTAVLAAAGH